MPEIFNSKRSRSTPASTQDEGETRPIPHEQIVSPRLVRKYSQVLSAHPPTLNPMAYFAPNPTGTTFDAQLNGEQIVLLLRQHPASQLKWFLIGIVLFLVPFLLGMTPLFGSLGIKYSIFLVIGWYLMWSGYCLEAFLNWFFNVNVVTNERIIDIDFVSLLFQDVSTTKLDKIEDVTSVTGGSMGSMFDYGVVKIQTAGATDELEFQNVPYPTQINSIINELLVEEEQEQVDAIAHAMKKD